MATSTTGPKTKEGSYKSSTPTQTVQYNKNGTVTVTDAVTGKQTVIGGSSGSSSSGSGSGGGNGNKESVTITPITPTIITGPKGGAVTGTSKDIVKKGSGGLSGPSQPAKVDEFVPTSKEKIELNTLSSSSKVKELNVNIERYKSAGYTQEESMALAQYSTNLGYTPNKDVAENYLRNSASSGRTGVSAALFGTQGIAPSGVFQPISFYGEKLFSTFGENVETGIKSYPSSSVVSTVSPKIFGISAVPSAEVTGKVVSTAANVGTYFIPVVGAARMAVDVGTTAEKVVVGKSITGIEIAGSAVIVGGGVYRGISKITMFPKVSTRFAGVSGFEGDKVATAVYSETTVKNIIGSKTFTGMSISKTDIIKTSEGVNIGKTTTAGAYSEFSPGRFNIGLNPYSKPTKFAAGSYDLSKPSEVIFKDINKIPYTKEGISGFTGGSVGAVATKKGGDYFASFGVGIQEGKATFVKGTTGLVRDGNVSSKAGYEGLIIQKSEEVSSGINSFSGGVFKSSPEFFTKLYGPVISSSISPIVKTVTKTKLKPLTKLGGGSFPLVSAYPIIEERYPSYVGGSMQPTLINKESKNIEDVSTGISQEIKVSQIGREAQINRFSHVGSGIQRQIPRDIQIPSQAVSSIEIQKPISKLKTINPSTGVPFFPKPFIKNKIKMPIPDFKFGFGGGQEGVRRIRAISITKYVPSYTALVFGIRGEAPRGIETGLRLRPITKGFSFANLFSPKKVKVKMVKRRK